MGVTYVGQCCAEKDRHSISDYKQQEERQMTENFRMIGWGYLVLINVITWIVYGVDKQKAQKGKWRISENTLIGLAVIGGSIGALCGMYYFRHKTKKEKFSMGIPVIFAMQMLVFWVIRNFIM